MMKRERLTALPMKPQDSLWTDDQWQAIHDHGDNILVAAAAGSGKTAVLVERLITKICNEERPVDVDQLLVATFTKAAADEMRQRIRVALEKKLQEHPQSEHLRRQLAFIHKASITTIHSFCLEVIQSHYDSISLDPGFRIANETEAALLRQDMLEELLEEYYGISDENSPFWRLVEAFGGERGDQAIYRLIQKLYDDARSHPSPEAWLADCMDLFKMNALSEDEWNQHIWIISLKQAVRIELQSCIDKLSRALRLTESPGGPTPYLDQLQEELTLVQTLMEQVDASWTKLYEAFQASLFGRLKPCRGEDVDKTIQEQVKALRKDASEGIKRLKEELFKRPLAVYMQELEVMAPIVQQLVELILVFSERYQEAKQAKGLVDFSDLEHYCLQILKDPTAPQGQVLPSEVALSYQVRFEEVCLDEYQDTNRVQEAIIALISKTKPGNRFMVGDVKQSIYRFRLAEPGLFIEKYEQYQGTDTGGIRIDLSRNFRSRQEIVDGVNFIFKQVMRKTAAEIDYDDDAKLVCGARYPDVGSLQQDQSIEMALIDRSVLSSASQEVNLNESVNRNDPASSLDEMSDDMGQTTDEVNDALELENAQLEARYIAKRIENWMDQQSAFLVTDKQTGELRPVQYRDIVILMRATQGWAPIFLEELKQSGIPAYAELNTGYFSAVEVQVMMALLKLIDNPLQDIPLVSVLRSPMVGLKASELAEIRIHSKGSLFFEAVRNFIQEGPNAPLSQKLSEFLDHLDRWRDASRQGSLSELIWMIYQNTGYFDFVGGLPGGLQRQANLRALYDRARQYEATSFRGLFRFLRFIERMQDSGGDLGTARALGEQENVVRIISIHKSKGLEFPVVFAAGMAKMFNQQDLNASFLIHRELGLGPKFMDTELRISYPTLPAIAIKKQLKMELLAEEMRILYVALTRAKEKCVLVGTIKQRDKLLEQWASVLEHSKMELPDFVIVKAKSYLDWLGPALIRHPAAAELRHEWGLNISPLDELMEDASKWCLKWVTPIELMTSSIEQHSSRNIHDLEAIRNLEPVSSYLPDIALQSELDRKLNWEDPYPEMQRYFAKTSVSELKRVAWQDEEEAIPSLVEFPIEAKETSGRENPALSEAAAAMSVQSEVSDIDQVSAQGGAEKLPQAKIKKLLRRPKFMQKRSLSPVELGTAYHLLMQHIPLIQNINIDHVHTTLDSLVDKALLTKEQSIHIQAEAIASFFTSPIGVRLLNAKKVYREVPFSYGLKAGDIYPEASPLVQQETILTQGVIDCLFEENGELVLVDYKTDATYGHRLHEAIRRYRIQLNMYAKAIEDIWGRKVKAKILYFFDGSHLIDLADESFKEGGAI